MTEVICNDTGSSRGRGNSKSKEEGVCVIRRPTCAQNTGCPYFGLRGLFLTLVVTCVIFKMYFFE